MATFRAPSPRYLGPPAHTTAGDNKPINRIVLHSTVSRCEAGAARATAAYFRTQDAGGSAHYVVDCDEVVQVVYDGVIAWHAPPNQHSLGIEMCDMPTSTSAERWNDGNHIAMLKLTAHLVAELCLAYGVPIRYVGPVRLRLGRKGITTHANVSAAFKQSTHWDPGAWPRHRFMRMVRAEAKALRAEARKKTPNRKAVR